MHYLIYIKVVLFLLLIGCRPIQAQKKINLEPFGCQPNFYQLKKNQLCVLSQRFDGTVWFQPILEPFSFPVSAMGLHAEEGLIYILNKKNGHLLKLGKLGKLEDLGLPKSNDSEPFPYDGVTLGAIGENYFFVYNQLTKSLYSINLATMIFRKAGVGPFFDANFVNISFDPASRQFICIDAVAKVLKIPLYGAGAKMEKNLPKLPSGRSGLGSIWSTKNGRWFVGRRQNTELYEINLEEDKTDRVATKLEQTIEDGTSCPYAAAPPFLDQELLNFYTTPYPDNRLNSVKWSDKGGLDIDYYELEKSTDGRFWQTVVQKPSASNGLPRVNPYSALDKSPSPQLNYYRLKQVSNYGSEQYSPTILKSKDSTVWEKPFITLSPNALFNVSSTSLICNGLQGQVLEIRIEDSFGQQVFETKAKVLSTQMLFTLPIQNLRKGIYNLKAICAKGAFVQRFLIF